MNAVKCSRQLLANLEQ